MGAGVDPSPHSQWGCSSFSGSCTVLHITSNMRPGDLPMCHSLLYANQGDPSSNQHLFHQQHDPAQDSDISSASSPTRPSLDQQERRTSLSHLSSHALHHALGATSHGSSRTSFGSKEPPSSREGHAVAHSSTSSATTTTRNLQTQYPLPQPGTSHPHEHPNTEQGYVQQHLSPQHSLAHAHRQSQPPSIHGATPRTMPAPHVPLSSDVAFSQQHCAYIHSQRMQDNGFEHDRSTTAWDISFDRGAGAQFGPLTGTMGQIVQGSNHTMLLHRHQQLHSEANKFTEDLLLATDNPQPLERFKALDRVMSTLRRQQVALLQPEELPAVLAVPSAWSPPPTRRRSQVTCGRPVHAAERTSSVCRATSCRGSRLRVSCSGGIQLLEVGECLAKFGNTEFLSERSCASRAITNRDYSALLRRFLRSHGPLFCEEFIEGLTAACISQSLADEALTVSTLLQTRCESAHLLFTQLIKGGGSRPRGRRRYTDHQQHQRQRHTHQPPDVRPRDGGGRDQQRRGGCHCPPGAAAAGAAGRADCRRAVCRVCGSEAGAGEVWAWEEGGGAGGGVRGRRGGGGRYRGGGGGGGEGLTRTLMRERTFAERAAVRQLAGCGEALRQSGVNDALLRNDWRLGAMRLAPPNEPMPPGYGSVDVNACNLNRFLSELDGPPHPRIRPALPAGPVL
ncbi:MAG: hypothetical protein WDW38_009355 [Sanguina aurantia]